MQMAWRKAFDLSHWCLSGLSYARCISASSRQCAVPWGSHRSLIPTPHSVSGVVNALSTLLGTLTHQRLAMMRVRSTWARFINSMPRCPCRPRERVSQALQLSPTLSYITAQVCPRHSHAHLHLPVPLVGPERPPTNTHTQLPGPDCRSPAPAAAVHAAATRAASTASSSQSRTSSGNMDPSCSRLPSGIRHGVSSCVTRGPSHSHHLPRHGALFCSARPRNDDFQHTTHAFSTTTSVSPTIAQLFSCTLRSCTAPHEQAESWFKTGRCQRQLEG